MSPRIRRIVLAALLLGSPAWAQTPGGQDARVPDAVRVEVDLPYAGTDNPRQKLDLYVPKTPQGERPLPIVASIHGGGWEEGDRRSDVRTVLPLVERGQYAVAAIGYRLSDEAIWPAQIHDCKAAIRWLRANAAKYNLDPDRIGVTGESAGGHLAAMLGTSGAVAALEGNLGDHTGMNSRVACVVDQFGPTDFLMGSSLADVLGFSPLDEPHSPVFRLLGGPVTQNKDKAREASPMTYVSPDDPPFLLIHGTHDLVVPCLQSVSLAAGLKNAGVEASLVLVAGGGHGDFGTPEPARRMRQFWDKHLLGKEVAISTEPIEAGAESPSR